MHVFSCLCGSKISRLNFYGHYQDHLQKDKVLNCSLCSKSFKRFNEFKNHLTRMHQIEAIKLNLVVEPPSISIDDLVSISIFNNLPSTKKVWNSEEYRNLKTKSNPIQNVLNDSLVSESIPADPNLNTYESSYNDFNDFDDFEQASNHLNVTLNPLQASSSNGKLSKIQNDLLASMKEVKIKNTITHKALVNAFSECTKTLYSNLGNSNFTSSQFNDAIEAINSVHYFRISV